MRGTPLPAQPDPRGSQRLRADLRAVVRDLGWRLDACAQTRDGDGDREHTCREGGCGEIELWVEGGSKKIQVPPSPYYLMEQPLFCVIVLCILEQMVLQISGILCW